jgi:hypothetical protein
LGGKSCQQRAQETDERAERHKEDQEPSLRSPSQLRQQIPHRRRPLARTLQLSAAPPRERSEKLFGTVSEITPSGANFTNRPNSRSQTGESTPVLIKHATDLRLRAERRAGELLAEMKAKGERAVSKDTLSRGSTMQPRELPKLADLGISKIQSSRWQKLAEMSIDDFEVRDVPAAQWFLNCADTRRRGFDKSDFRRGSLYVARCDFLRQHQVQQDHDALGRTPLAVAPTLDGAPAMAE